VIRRNDHLTGNALLGAGAVHHIMSVKVKEYAAKYELSDSAVIEKIRKGKLVGYYDGGGPDDWYFGQIGESRSTSLFRRADDDKSALPGDRTPFVAGFLLVIG